MHVSERDAEGGKSNLFDSKTVQLGRDLAFILRRLFGAMFSAFPTSTRLQLMRYAVEINKNVNEKRSKFEHAYSYAVEHVVKMCTEVDNPSLYFELMAQNVMSYQDHTSYNSGKKGVIAADILRASCCVHYCYHSDCFFVTSSTDTDQWDHLLSKHGQNFDFFEVTTTKVLDGDASTVVADDPVESLAAGGGLRVVTHLVTTEIFVSCVLQCTVVMNIITGASGGQPQKDATSLL